MMPLIEFCINNLTDDVLAAKKKLEEDPGLEVLDYYCLRHCDVCNAAPFALVNGKVVRAHTGRELLRKIYEAIEDTEICY
ncbi:MAG: DUF1450 domain-containing protein [Thermoactinomyces sp.]